MINIMVIPYHEDVQQHEVEWQAFKYINTTEDLAELYRRIRREVPGCTFYNYDVRNTSWLSVRLPEYLKEQSLKATQYVILNRCMEFDKERRDQSVL